MAASNPSEYLASKVKTASAPQLHLMLIEGAIRFVHQAQEQLESQMEGNANQAMLRALDIVAEMLAGVRHGDTDIHQKLAELYLYLFHTLTSAYVNADSQKLADVMRILQFERETWKQACELAASGQQSAAPPAPKGSITPPMTGLSNSDGLSIEA